MRIAHEAAPGGKLYGLHPYSNSDAALFMFSITLTWKGHMASQLPQAIQSEALLLRASYCSRS